MEQIRSNSGWVMALGAVMMGLGLDAGGHRARRAIHMVEDSFTEHWDRLLFRDYLIDYPEVASEYEALKAQ